MEEIVNEQYSNDELTRKLVNSKVSLSQNKKGDAYIDFLGSKVRVYDASLFALGSPDFDDNSGLEGLDIYAKVIKNHPFFNIEKNR